MKKMLIILMFVGFLKAEYSDYYRNASLFLSAIGTFKYEITPIGLKTLLNSGASGFIIIDLRSPSAYTKGHVKDAINIPYNKLFSPEYINKLPKDKKIIVYCQDESISPYVVALLRGAGFDAWQLKGGYKAWVKTGPVSSELYKLQIKEKKHPEHEGSKTKVTPQAPPPQPEDEEEEGC